MKSLSLKLEDNIFLDTEKVLSIMNRPRNRYINDAVDYYNKLQLKKALSRKLELESKLVANDSLDVLKEFEVIEYDTTTI